MSRKMASIRRIAAIDPIEGADAIEVATVDGWRVVIKKGEFQPGDLAVYCEVDSWIPHELAPFLSKGSEPREYNDVRGERLRTVRLRGQVSQGLLLPLEPTCSQIESLLFEGLDVSVPLNIQKWEAPVPARLAGIARGPFPSSVPKTDEERIQNLTAEWAELSQHRYEVTEKLEGSSMTVGLVENEFVVCSRNLNLTETDSNSLWTVARRYNIEKRLREFGADNLVIQGEIIGEGIQGNYYGIKGQDFYVFNIYDIRAGRYVGAELRKNICANLGLNHVPVISADTTISGTVDEILKMADGPSQLNPARLREGLVFKRINGPEHWKAVSNQYLLKNNG